MSAGGRVFDYYTGKGWKAGFIMKDYYTIGEISELYGIGTDSLRYYEEIGVLKPKRGKNGYRLYRLKDICRLNIIRDLLQLGFSMKQVKRYMESLNLDNTIRMLEDEMELIRRQKEKLRLAEQSIEKRMEHIIKYRNEGEAAYRVVSYPNRYCLQLNEDITRDEEVDFAIKRLQKRHEDKIRSIGDQNFGASLSAEDVKNGIYHLFHSVFFILQNAEEGNCGIQGSYDFQGNYDFLLPSGTYLCTFYRGEYRQSPQRALELLEEAARRGCRITGDILELYPIDNRYTMKPEEFVTELQIRVEEDC